MTGRRTLCALFVVATCMPSLASAQQASGVSEVSGAPAVATDDGASDRTDTDRLERGEGRGAGDPEAGRPREAEEAPPAGEPNAPGWGGSLTEAAPTAPPTPSSWTSLLPELPRDGWTVLGMVGVLLMSLLLVMVTSRLRVGLPIEGLIPNALALTHVLLQVFALLTAAGIVARLLPPSLEPAVPWAIVAVAVAIGWSSRDILPDLIAAAVIAFEQRIRPGIWMSTGELSGLVERRGLRAVWLRDGHGNRIAVPNRQLLLAHVAVQEAAGPVHEVTLRVGDTGPTKEVRRALLEATLTSPWARPDAAPAVRQDGGDPELWHIRAHLLEMRFAGRFEGDLLERTEEVLAAVRATGATTPDGAAGAKAPDGAAGAKTRDGADVAAKSGEGPGPAAPRADEDGQV